MLNYKDIKGSNNWIHVQEVKLGWSSDKKYYIVDNDNNKYILRVSDIKELEQKQQEFAYMKQVYKVNNYMSKPIELGTFDNNSYVYILLGFVEGKEVKEKLPFLQEETAYDAGYQAGILLRKMHEVSKEETFNWEAAYNKKIDNRITQSEKTQTKHPKMNLLIDYVNNNRSLLNGYNIIHQHGDYHIGNLIIDKYNVVRVIDFNRQRIADQYYEFNRVFISSQTSPLFASGQINGYFLDNIPNDFFPKMKFYAASVLVGVIAWAEPFGKTDIKFAMESIDHLLNSYNDFTLEIPSWYIKDRPKTNHCNIAPLLVIDDDLQLQKPKPIDILTRYEYGRPEEYRKMVGGTPTKKPYTLSNALSFYHRELSNEYSWMIYYKGKAIGITRIKLLDRNCARYSIGIFDTKLYSKGLGTKITKKVQDFAKELGVIKMELMVLEYNKRAIRCYEKCGFKQVRVLEGNLQLGNEFYNDVIMTCEL